MVEICAALGAHRFRAPFRESWNAVSNGFKWPMCQREAAQCLPQSSIILVDVSQHESNQHPSRIDELCNYKAHLFNLFWNISNACRFRLLDSMKTAPPKQPKPQVWCETQGEVSHAFGTIWRYIKCTKHATECAYIYICICIYIYIDMYVLYIYRIHIYNMHFIIALRILGLFFWIHCPSRYVFMSLLYLQNPATVSPIVILPYLG